MRLWIIFGSLMFYWNLCAQGVKLEPYLSGFSFPLYVTTAKDGTKTLYVVEQGGTIKIVNNANIQEKPFLDIQDRVKSGGERGLLGLTCSPQFKKNKKFYVNYTHEEKGELKTRISEFRSDNTSREKVILEFDQPYSNHNGGGIEFGPDGFLYIGTGDGGFRGDPHNNSQNLSTLLGKILRIDVSSKEPYSIPKDNPFVSQKEARGEIWAYGLRNPWRFSFDRKTHLLIAGDVGQDLWEEIDIIEKGKNYGWRVMEGNHCYRPSKNCSQKGLTLPVYEYGRKEGQSITGGYIYRGKKLKSLYGWYIYGDYAEGRIWGIKFKGSEILEHKLLLDTHLSISSFGEDHDGEIFVIDHDGGVIYRLVSDFRPKKSFRRGHGICWRLRVLKD